jgi:hypothetical protein
MAAASRTVVLLTTQNRPTLLRQSLPQIEREARLIAAPLVISDDQSSEADTLALLGAAHARGADVIRRSYVRNQDRSVDADIHHPPEVALRQLLKSPRGAELVRECVRRGSGKGDMRDALINLWDDATGAAHLNAQRNNVFGFRHVMTEYPGCDRILKVDDDVVVEPGAFERMLSTWDQAEREGHDVLAVSGIRTVNETIRSRGAGCTITHGLCSVSVLFRTTDWEGFLATTPEPIILRDGFDLAFTWWYAPRYRPGAVPVAVSPSAAYHTGLNGLHVRNVDLNCEYPRWNQDIVVQ